LSNRLSTFAIRTNLDCVCIRQIYRRKAPLSTEEWLGMRPYVPQLRLLQTFRSYAALFSSPTLGYRRITAMRLAHFPTIIVSITLCQTEWFFEVKRRKIVSKAGKGSRSNTPFSFEEGPGMRPEPSSAFAIRTYSLN